jgi:glycosyltransferase involved in cell wall biosynthesis
MPQQVYTRPYRVFQGLVNYGTQAGLISKALRESGINAFSLTCPDSFNRLTDYELKHGGSIPRKVVNQLSNYLTRTSCLWKYDIFHFYAGTSLWPRQLDFRILKALNKPIVMEYLGLDIQEYQRSIEKYKWTNVSGRMSPKEGERHDNAILKRALFEKTYCSKRLVCAPLYSEFAPDAELVPLALDVPTFPPSPLPPFHGQFRLLHLPTHTGNKGTSYIVNAVDRLKADGFPIEFQVLQGVPHSSLPTLYSSCHLFIDQILAGWYGTATIEAMACGRPVVVSVRDEYKQLTPFGEQLPAIHADPDTIYEALRSVLEGGYARLVELGVASRNFVEAVHSTDSIVQRLIGIYDSLWKCRA